MSVQLSNESPSELAERMGGGGDAASKEEDLTEPRSESTCSGASGPSGGGGHGRWGRPSPKRTEPKELLLDSPSSGGGAAARGSPRIRGARAREQSTYPTA